MKILFLTPSIPYPAISGGTLKSMKVIEYLSLNHDIEIVTLFKDEKDFSKNKVLIKNKRIKINGFYQSRERSIVNLFKSYFYKIPLSVYRNYSLDLEKYVSQNIERFDLVIVDHFLMFQYISNISCKNIYHSHNAEFIMWDRFADEQSNVFKKILIKLESIRIKKYEKQIINKANIVLAAPNDISELSKLTFRKDIFLETYHLGDDNILKLPSLNFDETDEVLLYVGTLTWEANIHGLLWFLENVWPKLKMENTRLKFHIVGKTNNDNIFDKFKSDNAIIWHGFVEDLTYFYNHSRVHIAPLLFGSGIKVKVISGLYRGLPTVTTTIGIEGLELEDGKHIMVANDSENFKVKILQLLQDRELWKKISMNSRDVAQNKYSWEYVFKKIDEAISKC